jgi:hypothetical protein
MLSSITSFQEFDQRLAKAMTGMDALIAKYPGDPALESIKKQLEALHSWTRDGKKPAQADKDKLNFGLLASRNVDELDADLARDLYALASYVAYW